MAYLPGRTTVVATHGCLEISFDGHFMTNCQIDVII